MIANFKIKNVIIVFMLSLLLLPMFATSVFAEDVLDTTTVNTVDTTTEDRYNPDKELPNVTIDQATQWAEKKGYDVISFLQRFIQPFAVIVFIVGAITSMLGFVLKNGLKVGLTIMTTAIIMYVGVLFAPEFLQYMSQWLMS